MTNAASKITKEEIHDIFPDIAKRYELYGNGPIGAASGFGAVWKAHDNWLDRDVAIKFSNDDMGEELKLCRDIEGQTVRTFEYFRSSENWNAFTMELLESPWISLRHFVENHKYKQYDLQHYFDCFEIVRSILNGLKHIHGRPYGRIQRYIHADIKPDNLFVLRSPKKHPHTVFRMPAKENLIKIIDLGISLNNGQTLKASTFSYSPLTSKARPGVDLYAVGVTFLELITGICPSHTTMGHKSRIKSFIEKQSSGSKHIDTIAINFANNCAKAANQNSISVRSCTQMLDSDIFELNGLFFIILREINKTLSFGLKKNELASALFKCIGRYYGWKKNSQARTIAIQETIKNLYEEGLLVLNGHSYFIR